MPQSIPFVPNGPQDMPKGAVELGVPVGNASAVSSPAARPVPTVTPAKSIDSLQAKYDDLAKQSADADKAGNAAEVARIKPLKMQAHADLTAAQRDKARGEKEAVRKEHGWKPA